MSNFKNTINAFHTYVSLNNKVSHEVEFYNGDKEFGTFFIYDEFLDTEHSLNYNNMKNIVKNICESENFQINEITENNFETTYTGTYKDLGIEIIVYYRANPTYGTGRITFNFTGKTLKSEKFCKQIPNITLGTVFHSSWGYDMTICQFFQVVRISGNTIYTKELTSKIVDGYEYGHKIPVLDKFKDEKVYRSKAGNYMNINNHHSTLWKGQKEYFNTLD